MALITCPECGKQVSSFATACPECGYPIASSYANHSLVSQPDPSESTNNSHPALSADEYKGIFSADKKQPVKKIIFDTTHHLFKLDRLFSSIYSLDDILSVDLKESYFEDEETKPELSIGFGKAYTGGLFQKKKKSRGFGTAITFKKETVQRLSSLRIIITVAGKKHPKELEFEIPCEPYKVGSGDYDNEVKKARNIVAVINNIRHSQSTNTK